MALKIKKQIKQSDGTILEIEGTEAEVEAFERKNEKKQQSEQAKKERKLLLESKKTIEKMTKKELMELIQNELSKRPPTTIINWRYDNGYWWRPWWANGTWSYQYTLSNPTITTNSISGANVNSVVTCSSADELSKTIGVKPFNILASSLSTPTSSQVTSSTMTGNAIANGTICATNGQAGFSTTAAKLDGLVTNTAAGGLTSGFINMNLKS